MDHYDSTAIRLRPRAPRDQIELVPAECRSLNHRRSRRSPREGNSHKHPDMPDMGPPGYPTHPLKEARRSPRVRTLLLNLLCIAHHVKTSQVTLDTLILTSQFPENVPLLPQYLRLQLRVPRFRRSERRECLHSKGVRREPHLLVFEVLGFQGFEGVRPLGLFSTTVDPYNVPSVV